MAGITVYSINAFVEDDGSGGNPAAVVLDAEALSPETRQKIAAKTGFSETAFVSCSNAVPRLHFFTPTRPIPHCGHATLAAFFLLAEKNKVSPDGSACHEAVDGTRRVRVLADRSVFMEMKPALSESVKKEELQNILDALKIKEAQMFGALPVRVVSSGNRFAVAALQSARDLAEVQPDFKRIREISNSLDLVGFYLFTFETVRAGRSAAARMFAPRFGIDEEAATGTAAGPLACYLYNTAEKKQTRFVFEQGGAMPRPRPSKIEAELECEGGSVKTLWVGGRARMVESKSEIL